MHSLKSKMLSRKGSGSGLPGQRLALNALGRVGEMSPRNSPSKKGDNLTKPELNRVQSTTLETNSYGNPGSDPRTKIIKPKRLKSHPQRRVKIQKIQKTQTGSSLAESVRIESASSLGLDSSEEEERGNRQGPHRKTATVLMEGGGGGGGSKPPRSVLVPWVLH